MNNTIILDKINFHFMVNDKPVLVQWLHVGRGYVQGREYAKTYKVFVDYGDGAHYTASLQANITNSLDLLKKSITTKS